MKWSGFKKKYRRSLHLRIFLTMSITGIIPVYLFGFLLVYGSYRDQLSAISTELQYQSVTLVSEMEEKNYIANMSQPDITAEITQLASFYGGRIVLVDENFIIRKDTFYISEGKYNISEDVMQSFEGVSSSRYYRDEQYFELTLPIEGSEGEIKGAFIITVSTEQMMNHIGVLWDGMLVAAFIISMLIIALALLFSSHFTKPLRKIVRAIDSSSQNVVGDDIQVNDCKETYQISQAYNRTLSRLRALDDSRQQFVSNVSHELKTPITSVKVLADSLLVQDEVPVEIYREFMTDISGEIDRESRIIDDLLTLVRMDKSGEELNISETDINEMLENIMKRLRPLAVKNNVDLILESFRSVVADVDEEKLDLAITNLVENAIKYNVDDGWVHVSLNADHQYFYIKVSDSGIGIPEEDWNNVFERFYRVDKARSHATGGTGLGLSITRNIVSMHHGEIRIYSVEGEGTTFTVRISRTFVREEADQ